MKIILRNVDMAVANQIKNPREFSNSLYFSATFRRFVSTTISRVQTIVFLFVHVRAVYIKWKMRDVDRLVTVQARVCPYIFNICVSHQSYGVTFLLLMTV